LQRTGNMSTQKELPNELEQRLRLSLEFHRWGSAGEGVTEGKTIYAGTFSDLRSDAARLQGLCSEIARHLGSRLPGKAETLILAGRLYRRSADYARACEYFLEALELVHGSRRPERGPCA